jgi:hypothetical protein
MAQPGHAFYCRWCSKPWPSRSSLHRHSTQAEPCATRRWNHLASLARKAHAATFNLAVPASALAPRRPGPSRGDENAKRRDAASPKEPSPSPSVERATTPGGEIPAVDVFEPDEAPAANNMDWAPEENEAMGAEDDVGSNAGGSQASDNANHPPVSVSASR